MEKPENPYMPFRRTYGDYTKFINDNHFFNHRRLVNKEFYLRHKSGRTILHLHNISNGLKQAVYKISKNDKLDDSDKDTLSNDDITMLNQIHKAVRCPTDINGESIIYKSRGPQPPHANDILRRIQVLTSEIDSGNDGPEVKNELKKFVACAAVKHLISDEIEKDLVSHYKL